MKKYRPGPEDPGRRRNGFLGVDVVGEDSGIGRARVVFGIDDNFDLQIGVFYGIQIYVVIME